MGSPGGGGALLSTGFPKGCLPTGSHFRLKIPGGDLVFCLFLSGTGRSINNMFLGQVRFVMKCKCFPLCTVNLLNLESGIQEEFNFPYQFKKCIICQTIFSRITSFLYFVQRQVSGIQEFHKIFFWQTYTRNSSPR